MSWAGMALTALSIALTGCATVGDLPLLTDAANADTSQSTSDGSTEVGDASEAGDASNEPTPDANLCEVTGGTCVVGAVCSLRSAFVASCGPGGATCCLCVADADVPLIVASNYDQSCTVDSDCIPVGVGNPCTTACLTCLWNAAINRASLVQYRADVARTPAGTRGAICSCPPPPPDGVCCAGVCNAGNACSTSLAGDAGADATEQ